MCLFHLDNLDFISWHLKRFFDSVAISALSTALEWEVKPQKDYAMSLTTLSTTRNLKLWRKWNHFYFISEQVNHVLNAVCLF